MLFYKLLLLKLVYALSAAEEDLCAPFSKENTLNSDKALAAIKPSISHQETLRTLHLVLTKMARQQVQDHMTECSSGTKNEEFLCIEAGRTLGQSLSPISVFYMEGSVCTEEHFV